MCADGGGAWQVEGGSVGEWSFKEGKSRSLHGSYALDKYLLCITFSFISVNIHSS